MFESKRRVRDGSVREVPADTRDQRVREDDAPGGRCGAAQYAGQKAPTPGVGGDEWNTYVMNPWPGTTYDQVAEYFQPGIDWTQ